MTHCDQLDFLKGVLAVAVLPIALICWIWTGWWQPFASSLVLFLPLALLSAVAKGEDK